MEVNATPPGTSILQKSSGLAESNDFETFLRMLTTQIQNQDPLSPMQANEFASQLASFTMVEQQTLTNQKLDALLNGGSASDVLSFAGLVGRTVVHDAQFKFTGAPVEFEFTGDDLHEPAKLVVLNSEGSIVSEQIVMPGSAKTDWTGLDSTGRFVEIATYAAELRSLNTDQPLEIDVRTVSTIEEIRFEPSGVTFLLASGSVIDEGMLRMLR